MQLIKNNQIVEEEWTTLSDDAPLPESGNVLVGIERWNREESVLSRRTGLTGVKLTPSDEPTQLHNPSALQLIAIDFPKFSDGRGYSQARLLRERCGYKGELRAVGNVLRDQLYFMHRCGIDSYALQPGKDIQGALEAFNEFSVRYQAAADDPRPIYRRDRA